MTPGLTTVFERTFIFDRLVPEEVGLWSGMVGDDAQVFQAQVEAQALEDEFAALIESMSDAGLITDGLTQNFDMDAFLALPVIPEIPPTAWTPDLGLAVPLSSISNFDMGAFIAVNTALPVIPEATYWSELDVPAWPVVWTELDVLAWPIV